MSLRQRKRLIILVLLALVIAGFLCLWAARTPMPWENRNEAAEKTNGPASALSRLEARENQADRTVWAKEMLAESCGRVFEDLWDEVNRTTNKLSRLADFAFQEILVPQWGPPEHLAHGIDIREGTGAGKTLSNNEWKQWVHGIETDGWQLENLEFRHQRFDTDTNGQPWQSQFYFSAHLTNAKHPERAMLEGDLVVDWALKKAGGNLQPVKRLDASRLKLKSRAGDPFFRRVLNETIKPIDQTGLIDPLILYDLDGDGLSEIILVANNIVYHRRDAEHYEAAPLCRYPIRFSSTALIADFDGDGFADLLCANGRGLFLFKGSPKGTFDDPPRLVWAAEQPLKNAMVMTCGDIEQTGHLDVFLGQYRVPTLGQVIRPHYYDSNDGFPSYLLHNDGQGNFTDITRTSGLGAKRWRRTYSASFVDLDEDGHLDLMVVSDFAGLDVYKNDGKGHFADVTKEWIPEAHAFGMASALADFNADGRLDVLMIGMPSATADRLEHLGLSRAYSAEDKVLRPAMTHGNRLYLAQAGGGFAGTPLSESISRSGWSWGCGAADFDNDGFPDLYIANGLESGRTVQDYESEFWLHDIFVDGSVDDVIASRYFLDKFKRTRGSGWSYGGYEKNRLFLNQHGESFIEIGHLAGVSLEQDSRNVVADDLDGDGRVDLVVTTLEVWPEAKQTLQIYRNELQDNGRWIGFGFREGANSPVGASVTIHYGNRSATRQIVTGDSHRSQSANTLHFGLGEAQQVDAAEVRWIGGSKATLTNLELGRYHRVATQEHR